MSAFLIKSFNPEAYAKPCETFKMELLYKNSQRLRDIIFTIALSCMFNKVLNLLL